MEFVWDPRKMIGPPFTECPACHQGELGTLSISNNRWTRRCRACMHTATTRLPDLRKRIIYIDQMVLSNIAKALDPVWRATRGPQDSFWLELFDQLECLVKLQLVVCVESPIHDRESSVTAYADILRRIREYLSAGVEFESDTVVLQRQLHHALDMLEGHAPVNLNTYIGDGAREIVHGRLDQWSDRLQISIHFSTAAEDIDAYRSSRDEAGEVFKKHWERWMAQTGRRFEDWYNEERRGRFPTWLMLYQQHLERLQRQGSGVKVTNENLEDMINPPMAVMVVYGLIRHFTAAGSTYPEAHERLAEFFASEAALAAPANDISSLLLAALARKAASGQKTPPNRGTVNDITVISSYLPYCEALYVDDQFAGLLREEPLATRLRPYGARVFSNRTRREFLDHLKAIQVDAPADHLARVSEVYGDGWLTPFHSILELDRARRGTLPR